MSNKKFTAQTRVALKGTSIPLARGTVVGDARQQQSSLGVPLDAVVVEWDNGVVQKITIRSLMLESEAVAEETRLAREQEKMEGEYEETRKEIAEKMNAAAMALREAATLAQTAGSELQDFYDEVRPFLRAMDDAGWSTSSLSC